MGTQKRAPGRRSFLLGAGALASVTGCAAQSVLNSHQAPVFVLADLETEGVQLGVAALDPVSGQSLFWRAEDRFPYCSTFKIFLATATLERVQRGQECLDRTIPIHESDMVPHAPVTQRAIGSDLTIESLCQAAVELSDNPAANILVRELGGLDTWRSWYPSIGDEITRVDRPEPMLNASTPGDPRDTTTPAQTVRNLHSIFQSNRLSTENRNLLLRWMIQTPAGDARIRAAVPSGYKTAHKMGTGAQGTTNDIGLVWPPRGDAIYIAAYLTGGSDLPLHSREARLAEAVRRALWTLSYSPDHVIRLG